MRRAANSERSTVVEEGRKTPPEQVKAIAAAGGLGDVVGALPKALSRHGHCVMVVAPQCSNYLDAWETGIHRTYSVSGQVPWHMPCGVVCHRDGNLVFIAYDWHTALLPVYLQAYDQDNGLMEFTRSVLVIHNMAHQGHGPVSDYAKLAGHYIDRFHLLDPIGGEHMNVFMAGIAVVTSAAASSGDEALAVEGAGDMCKNCPGPVAVTCDVCWDRKIKSSEQEVMQRHLQVHKIP